MNVWQRITFCAAIALLALGPAAQAFAGSISGRASTVFEWFDDADEDTATPVYQYLLLNATDIGGTGLNFRGYGRLADDLSNEVDVDSELYFAYLEKRDLIHNLDFRLGRQFIATTAGASLMDGLELKYRDLGPFSLKVFGGGDATLYEDYESDDLIFGAEIAARLIDRLDIGASYVLKLDDDDVAHELFGIDFQYEQPNLFTLYNETQISYLTKEITYFLGGFKYHRSAKWNVKAEYLYSLPVFSATSIYSVFAADEYEEILAEINYYIMTGLRAFGRYTREMYDSGFDDANVFEVGLEKIRTNKCSGYLTGVFRDDPDGQDLYGFKAHAAYRFTNFLEAGIGAHVDVLERRLEDDDETTSTRFWADATAYITKKINLQGKVERVHSDLWDHYYRGRVRLNILF